MNEQNNFSDNLFQRKIYVLRRYVNKSVERYFKGEHNKHIRYITGVLIGIFVVFSFVYNVSYKPPKGFPYGSLIEIEKGQNLSYIADYLERKSVIRSAFMYRTIVRLIAGDKNILSGEYFFSVPISVWGVAERTTRGRFGLDPIRVVLPEGVTVFEIAEVLDWKLPSFPVEEFLKLAKDKEGYLFPDTYLFLPNVSPEQIIKELTENFDKKTESLSEDIKNSGHTLKEIIIMASIIERETITDKDRKLVSGVLWKRIKIGMPLQVDATFSYVNGKNTFQLSLKDLKIDSPYNTYKYKGLPIAPISNPGFDSIVAAIKPQKSPYLYYLSDMNSTIHYSKDFEGHKRNKRKYY
jgi:UPF0755 protein